MSGPNDPGSRDPGSREDGPKAVNSAAVLETARVILGQARLHDLLVYPIEAVLRAEKHKDTVAIEITIARDAAPDVAGSIVTTVVIGSPALLFADRLEIARRIVRQINGAILTAPDTGDQG